MLKAPGIHFLCQFHPIIIVESKIDFLAVHCHMVPWGVYSIGPVAVNNGDFVLIFQVFDMIFQNFERIFGFINLTGCVILAIKCEMIWLTIE